MRKLLPLLFTLSLAVSAGEIGYYNGGVPALNCTSFSSADFQRMNVSQTYTPAGPEEVFELHAYVEQGATTSVRMAVYDIEDGADSNAVLVGSETVVTDATTGWYSTVLETPWPLTAGREYAVAWATDGPYSLNWCRDWGGRSNHIHDTDTGAVPFAASWTDNPSPEGWDMSFYAETRPAAPTGPSIQILRRRGR